jgi:hypothetical protein
VKEFELEKRLAADHPPDQGTTVRCQALHFHGVAPHGVAARVLEPECLRIELQGASKIGRVHADLENFKHLASVA